MRASVILGITLANYVTSATVLASPAVKADVEYIVRVKVQSSTCIPCIKGFLDIRSVQTGALAQRLRLVVESSSTKTLRDVSKLVADTMLVSLQSCPVNALDSSVAEVYLSESQITARTFSIPAEVDEILPFLDSLDAAATEQSVTTAEPEWSAEIQTKILFNENIKVHVHAEGNIVSMAASDRVLCIAGDKAYVLPQYHSEIPDSLRRYVMIASGAVCVDADQAIYRLATLEEPIDTVIRGKVAKLFTKSRQWVCRTSRNQSEPRIFKAVDTEDKVFGMWVACDTLIFVTPESDQPGVDLPTTFSLRAYSAQSLKIGNLLAKDIPAKYYPTSTAIADGDRDTLYLCNADSGCVRVTPGEGYVRLPRLSYLQQNSSLVRCISFRSSLLLTFDAGHDNLKSVVVSSIGVRQSPIFTHSRNVVFSFLPDSQPVRVVAYSLHDGVLSRKTVWPTP